MKSPYLRIPKIIGFLIRMSLNYKKKYLSEMHQFESADPVEYSFDFSVLDYFSYTEKFVS